MEMIALFIISQKLESLTTTAETKAVSLNSDLHETRAAGTPTPPAVVLNQTYGGRHQDSWISSIKGDLSIRNLRLDDAAMYRCERQGIFYQLTELQIGKVPVFDEWRIIRLSRFL